MNAARDSSRRNFPPGLRSRYLYFGLCVAVSFLIFRKALIGLLAFSLDHDYASHILLIPFISGFLFYLRRRELPIQPSVSGAGIGIAVVGLFGFLFSSFRPLSLDQGSRLELSMALILLTWLGIFLSFFGFRALRNASFPVCFMFLMIPIPAFVIHQATYALQKGSTTITCWFLELAGVPILRDGFVISMPSLKIVVAEECSSIRSSIALSITSLLAASLFLKSTRYQIIFVLLSFPVALVKNGIRIAALSLLSIHVDMSFMTGRLHHDGGFVFFLVALLIMYGVLLLLQKFESNSSLATPAAAVPLSSTVP